MTISERGGKGESEEFDERERERDVEMEKDGLNHLYALNCS